MRILERAFLLGIRSADSIRSSSHYAPHERDEHMTAPDKPPNQTQKRLQMIDRSTRKRPLGRISGRFSPARGLESGQSPADATMVRQLHNF
jgi:hypothetical protein